MRQILPALASLACLSLVSCSLRESNPPAFNDEGKTVSALIKEWKCEGIDFEHDDELQDSTLAIYFINSKSVPTLPYQDTTKQLYSVCLQIKHALAKPELYNRYHLTFQELKGNKLFGTTGNVLSDEFLSRDLH